MTEAGWYYAEGDPPGTTRYWDGTQWVGDPVHTPPAAPGGEGFADTTTGGGAFRQQLASPGSRIGARVIDIVIALIIALIFFVPVITGVIDDIDALGSNPSDSEVEQVLTDAVEDNVGRLALFSLIGLLWDFLWVGFAGGTPGKLMLGLRVARADNRESPPGWGKAALRSLNRLVGLIPGLGGIIGGLVGLASLIMLFVDDQHRTVMDRIATTVVVKK